MKDLSHIDRRADAHFDGFYGFSAALLEPRMVPEGTIQDPQAPRVVARHGMLYPERYPPDKPFIEAVIAGNTSVELISPEYKAHARRLKDGGILLKRLMVMRESQIPGVPDDEPYLTASKVAWAPLTQIEEVRVTGYETQLPRLTAKCGEDALLIKLYKEGVADEDPKVSYWSIAQETQDGERRVETVGLMNYEDQQFTGLNVWQANSSQELPAAISEFEEFWYRVFTEEQQSVALQALRITA